MTGLVWFSSIPWCPHHVALCLALSKSLYGG